MIKRLLLSLLVFIGFQVQAINVVLVNPTAKEETFWALITQLTQEAAKDLSINLTVYYSDSHRVIQSELITQIVTGKNKPDFLIFLPYGGSILRSFDALEKSKTPFVTLERVFDIKRVSHIGKPQEVYKYWLGEIYNDNVKAGTLLANRLYEIALEKHIQTDALKAIALNGDYYAEAIDRAEGFYRSYIAKDDVIISKIIPLSWNRQNASDRFLKLNERYEKSDIIWSASDQMALGVLDVVEQTGLEPNKDFVIGGFDLIPEAIQAIHDGKMTASIGGHFLQGVWALIKIYDYHQGIKNVFKKGDVTAYVQSYIVDHTNIDKYIILAKENDYAKIDFAEFSLTHQKSKDADDYQLNLENYVEKLIVSQK